MSKQRKGRGLQEISWKCLVLGDNYPQDFNGGRWVSPPRKDFPIDIVLGLEGISNIYKVVIEVNQQFVPSKIELALGLGENYQETSYRTAREAEFSEPVCMDFGFNQRMSGRMEAKNPFMESTGQYLWILVYEPTDFILEQVGLENVTVLGYVLEEEADAKTTSIPTRNDSGKQSRPNTKSSTSARSRSRSSASRRSQNFQPESNNNSADQMRSGNEAAEDPLKTVRRVKKVITEKMHKAEQSEHEVEKIVCVRSIQRLTEYEAILEDLSNRRSNALVHNQTEQAERLRLAMADYRDTALRSIHVDLLLGRDELRAIGGHSDWASDG
ncbi:hypothetical protein GCK32_001795 [Trichostrongylus colubriformis]|uniref:Centrosomal protein CEP104 N-terminal domain-containing protein n=1 Tax=Trichostrongylus colubriformis TaxID=6319 RepID=A0AAN8F2I5_TRICO